MPLCKHQVTARYHCSVTSPPGIPERTGSRSRKYASRTLLSCIPVPALSVKSGQVRGATGGTRVAGKTEARGAFLTCRARLSNEYAPSANFRPFPRAVVEVRQTPRVVEYNELARSCTPATNMLNMHEALHTILPSALFPTTDTYVLELNFA